MIITIQLESDVPLYQQIRDQVVGGIASGDLEPGEQLPSVRALGRELGINLHTVNKAYALLQQEGYVAIQGRKGVRVLDPQGSGGQARKEKAQVVISQAMTASAQEAHVWGISEEEFIQSARDAYSRAEEGVTR